MKSLMDLTTEMLDIEKALIENEGELSPELAEIFDLTSGDLKTKVDRYWHVMKGSEYRAAYFKSIEDQAHRGRKMFEGLRERLKENVRFAMQSMTVGELKGHDYRFKLSKPRAPKLIVNAAEVPPEYMREVRPDPYMEPDIEAIEKAMILGEKIPGCSYEDGKGSLNSYVNNEPKEVKK